MCKLPSRKLLVTLVAGALFLPQTGFALGLGEIEVNSSLNQKLNADIELLSAQPEDAENIIIKLASRKEFSRAGLDRPYLLNDLRFKSEMIDGAPHIKVSSGKPIREPFLNFLIEIDWPNGHLIREYTVLLDPPVFMTQSASTVSTATAGNSEFRPDSAASTRVVPATVPAAVVSASSRPSTQVSQPKASASVTPVSTVTPAPTVQQQAPANQAVSNYRIKPGDTAWTLAENMRPDQTITVPQMISALLRANPEAFIQGNINGLKRGYILRMPDAAQMAAMNQVDATAMVREHWALWRQYQQSRTTGQPASAMPADDMGAGSDSSDVMVADNEARLEIAAGDGTSTVSGKNPAEMSAQELRAELSLSRERVETERVEKEALQQRITALEQNAEKMKGLLSIEDEELSRVQSLNLPAEETTGEITADTESIESDAVADVTGETSDEISGEISEATTAEELTEAAGDNVADDAVFTDEISGEISETAAAEKIADAAPVADTVSPQSQLEKRPPADPLTQLLNDPILLAAAGGGLLLVAAFIGIMIKRRKTGAAATASGFDNLEILADNDAEEKTAAEAEGKDTASASEQISEDETLASIEDTVINKTETSAAVEDDEPGDDVIAEADVYLAYGIYQQAEDLLKQAIIDSPDRIDYQIKLAETHYASKNADAFIEIATEIKQYVDDDDSAEWKKMMVMGQDLCADNAMFQGVKVDELDVDAFAPDEPLMDFDLGVTEDDEANITSDVDLTQDDELLELPETEEDETSAEMLAEPVDEIEFDLSDTGAIEETATVEDEFSLDIDVSELGIDTQGETEEVTKITEESLDLADQEMADTSLENDAEADVSVAKPEEEELEELLVDLSDEVEIDSLEEIDVIEGTKAAANDALAEEEDFDLSSLSDVDEVSTKLDLARAYLDMGDHEGTRGILEEVLVDGDDEQKQEANDLMSKLA